MTPLSAQEEAVLLLARYRGVVSEESLRAALVMARQDGQQFLNSLTGTGALSAGQAGDLNAALQEVRFACGNGCPELSYDELAGAFGLACPRCRMALRPRGPGIGRERASARLAGPGEPVARRSLGPYTLLSTLGRGSYGVVYLAQHPARNRLVAVKVLLDPGDESLRARFELEAKIARRLDHPGIVPVVDAGRDAGHDYYAMEYCAGQTLRERIRQGPLPAVEAAGLIAQIARAVHYAHEQGVLHRDLKPANVILAKGSGRPRLTDFGLARDPSLRMSLTATGEILGSPAYMAPEQIRGERDLDARADVYALGVSLYQCLAGRLPFEAANAAQMADRVLEGDAPRIGDVPGELEGICRRAMALEREDRHPSALALAETLERFCGTGRAPEPLTAQAERLVRPDARPFVPPAEVELSEAGSRWTAPVIGISAVLLPVFLYLALFPPGRQARQPEPEVVVSPAPLPPRSGAGFESGLGPGPSQPAHLLRRETLDRLDALAIDIFRVDKRHALDPQPLRALARRLVTALDEYPDDPRLQTLQLYVELSRGKRGPFEVHRRWRELARQSPGLTQAEIGIVARLAHELGFQRAASDLLDQALPTLREPWLGVTALQMKVGAAWPVQDLERALLIADETLGLLERRDVLTAEHAHPTGYEVHGNRGLLRLYARDRAGAVADFRQAMALANNYDSRRIYEHGLAAIQRGEFTPDNALQSITLVFGVGELGRLTSAEGGRLRPAHPELSASRLAEVAPRVRDPALRAVCWLKAARNLTFAGQAGQARQALLQARQVELASGRRDLDVRLLIRRSLARCLLQLPRHDPGWDPRQAERLALEAARPPELDGLPPSEDPRSPGEIADAWVLVARARLAQGRRYEAAKALDQAAAAEPSDRRELEAIKAR